MKGKNVMTILLLKRLERIVYQYEVESFLSRTSMRVTDFKRSWILFINTKPITKFQIIYFWITLFLSFVMLLLHVHVDVILVDSLYRLQAADWLWWHWRYMFVPNQPSMRQRINGNVAWSQFPAHKYITEKCARKSEKRRKFLKKQLNFHGLFFCKDMKISFRNFVTIERFDLGIVAEF